MARKILAVAETRNGSIKRPSYEVTSVARTLASGGEVTVLLIGHGVADRAASFGSYGAARVLCTDDASTASATTEQACRLVGQAMDAVSPDAVLFPATMAGKDLAAAVAAARNLPLATDCTTVEATTEGYRATRPVYAGKAMATVASSTLPFLASIRPNSYTAEASGEASADVQTLAPADGALAVELVETKAVQMDRPDVAEADAVVSGGRSLGSAEAFEILEALATAIGPGCGVGASRAAVDAGYRPHRDQVGQTGKTVSPALYIACGISGAIQHLAGMKTSKVIVAINKDPEAPIFKVTDYGIVGDLFEVVPELTKAIAALER